MIFPKDETDSKSVTPVTKVKGQIEDMGKLLLSLSGKLSFSLEVRFPEGSHLTDDAPSSWILYSGLLLYILLKLQ